MPTTRRPRGEGTLYYSESHERWEGTVTLPNGNRRTVTSSKNGTKQTKYKEAQAKLAELKKQIERGVTPTSQTVKEYLEAWMAEKRIEAKASTDQSWSNVLNNHIIPGLGSWQLTKLSRDAVQEYIKQKITEGLAASTIRFHHEIISDALNDAVKNDLLVRSPGKNITLPRLPQEEMQFLDLEQARRLLAFLKESKYRQHEVLIMLAITSGMRKGEIQGLRWSDIDFDQQEVHVRRTVSWITGTGYVETEPKTKKSRRSIPLTDEMIPCLRAHHAWQRAEHLRLGIRNERDLVFCSRGGEYLSDRGIYWTFKRSLKAVGLPDIRFHDLRHTAATLLLSVCGMTLKELQETLGHTNIATTMKYLHVLPDKKGQAIRQLGKHLA